MAKKMSRLTIGIDTFEVVDQEARDELLNKADASRVSEMETAMSTKANTADVNAALALKANLTDVAISKVTQFLKIDNTAGGASVDDYRLTLASFVVGELRHVFVSASSTDDGDTMYVQLPSEGKYILIKAHDIARSWQYFADKDSFLSYQDITGAVAGGNCIAVSSTQGNYNAINCWALVYRVE